MNVMGTITVLVVEDEFIIGADIKARLDALGYRAICGCPSGERALEICADVRPDLVLVDAHLAGAMDGIDAAIAIRERFRIPVVFLTAYSEDDTLQRVKAAGPFGYILKPFDDRELKTVIEMALDKHEAEEALRRSEQTYRTLFDTVPAGVVYQAADGRVISANPAALRILGLSLEQILGRDSIDPRWRALREDGTDLPGDQHPSMLALRTGQTVIDRIIAIFNPVLKKHIWIKVSAVPLFSGREISEVYTWFEDITERRAAEVALADEMALRRTLFEHSLDGLVVIDEQRAVIEANRSFSEMLGYSQEELAHLHVWDWDAQWTREELEAQFPDFPITSVTFETRHRRKDGAIIDVEVTANPVEWEGRKLSFCVCRNITEKKHSEEQIWKQARLDALTGLPNRRMFQERLEQESKQSKRTGLPMALMLLDLDFFKEVNDTLGHSAGDILLRETAVRLLSCVRETDTVARLGGDEFTLILGGLAEPQRATRVAEAILEVLARPFELLGETVHISCSIGITVFPGDAADTETLLKNADQAMYAAKQRGRNRYHFFTQSLQDVSRKRIKLLSELRGAIAEGQFVLHYQPIVELASGAVRKAEALVRWQHPTRGLVGPLEFIPLAEETGLIDAIGDWVFCTAASQVAVWRKACDPAFQISVNKSPGQFRRRNSSHGQWAEYMRKLGLSGDSMLVEITEGLLLDGAARISDQLLYLRELGVNIAVDDFGTGYSALSQFKKFNIDYLKIGRSFTGELKPDSGELVLCEAITLMAHKLGVKVIAEGIETQEQHQLVRASGCDYAQGYWFAKPMPAEEFGAWLRTNGRDP